MKQKKALIRGIFVVLIVSSSASAINMQWGTPIQIENNIKKEVANHGRETAILFNARNGDIVCVWRDKTRTIRYARRTEGKWGKQVITPYHSTKADSGAIDAALDSKGHAHFIVSHKYGYEKNDR